MSGFSPSSAAGLSSAATGDRLTLISTSGTAIAATGQGSGSGGTFTSGTSSGATAVTANGDTGGQPTNGIVCNAYAGGTGGTFNGGPVGGQGSISNGAVRGGRGATVNGGSGDGAGPNGGDGLFVLGGNGAASNGNGGIGIDVTGGAPNGAGTAGIALRCTQVNNNYAIGIYGDTTSPVKAPIHIDPQDAQPTGAHLIGDMYVTSAGVLKICTVAGTPGTWVSVGAQV